MVASGCLVLRIPSYRLTLTSYVSSTHLIRGFQCASCSLTSRSGDASWKLRAYCSATLLGDSPEGKAHQTVSVSR